MDWYILALNPEILTHDGVVFTTTNNIYPGVIRGTGAAGFEAMFAAKVKGRYGQIHLRDSNTPSNWTTHFEAEVLYPREVSTNFLRRIYVRTNEDQDSVMGQLTAVGHDGVESLVAPELFEV